MSETALSYTKTRWRALHLSERRALLMLGDLLAISIALGFAVWVRIPGVSDAYVNWFPLFASRLRWWLLLWGIWVPVAVVGGCYELRCFASGTTSAIYTAGCAFVVALIYFLVPWISAPLTFSRTAWFLFAFLSVAGVALWRTGYAAFVSHLSFTRRALVVGASDAGAALSEIVAHAGEGSGIELVGFLDEETALSRQQTKCHPILGCTDELLSVVQRRGIDEIVVAVNDLQEISQNLFRSLVQCWERGLDIVPMPLFYEEVAGAIPLDHVGRNLFVLVDHNRALETRIWGWARRLLDLFVGVMGMVILAPIFPLIALAIVLDSRGPILYSQERVGLGGQPFRLFKFRSMVQNAEQNGAVWAKKNDARVTRVGRLLRATRLDELPQLWNVLKGDMTLVGPRPERPEFVTELGELLPYYAIRHSIKPGLTGWAQVRYHYGNSVDDARMKLEYDLYYVKRRGPVLDALIVLLTLRVVATFRGT